MDEKDRDVLWSGLTQLPVEIQQAIGQLVREGRTADEFVSALMVGPCPNCGSEYTRDGDDAGIPTRDTGDPTVGVCFNCGYLWCLECGNALTKLPCQHWAICDSCEDNPTEEEELEQEKFCPYDGRKDECPKLIGGEVEK